MVINGGNGLSVEVDRDVHGHERERGYGVGDKSPFNPFPSAMNGAKKRGHTSEEHHDNDT